MASIKTPAGRLHYKPKNLFLGCKQIDRETAFANLKDLLEVMENHSILVSPALGTLLGIIRENNFIEWDEDIDLFVLEEDKDKLLTSFWALADIGFELVRVDRCGLLYSVMRNGEYIDFYIMQRLSPEVRGSGDIFMLERHLTDLIDWDFRGLSIKVPRDYEEFLSLRYGDWRTPVKYANFSMTPVQKGWAKLKNVLKSIIPRRIKRSLLKAYHRPSFNKFLSRCADAGISFNYKIDY